MIGVSLPFDWLCGAPHTLGDVDEVLVNLRSRGVRSVELRAVRPEDTPSDVLCAAMRLWREGFEVTVHASLVSPETAVQDVFGPLTDLLAHNQQEKVTVTLHPTVGDNVAMLQSLADHAQAHDYPIVFALENNRLLPNRTEGDSAALVFSIVEEAARPNVGICFDMGHYMYYLKKNCPSELDRLPGKQFWKRVVHTHIHALNGFRTHFPLDRFELPLKRFLDAICFEYFGAYNVELDFSRFSDAYAPQDALFGSVETLASAMPPCARLYEEIRTQFDTRFQNALSLLKEPKEETRFSLIQSSSFLFQTNGFNWAMDIAFRNAYRLAKTPHRVAELLSGLELMIISHGHADHFEERTVRVLAETDIRWVIPDFLVDTAISWGVRAEKMIVAHAGEAICVGPLTILPFPGRHFRPVTGKGTKEYGYHISAEGAPSMAFPVDTRNFSLEGLPEIPTADYCFANVWLGDKNSFAEDYGALLEDYVHFMLHFSRKNMIFAHLYECNRRDADMWREEHAEIISDAIRTISPDTRTITPRPGEVLTLE